MSVFRITLYNQSYLQDFVRLNLEWIRTFFSPESADYAALNDPENYILNQGGQIFFALNEEEYPVGCCALINHPLEERYELAKMAVSPVYRGKGMGRLLGEAVLTYAREQNIHKIYLEGNTRLVSSIILYRKLGFREIEGDAVYERCNIIMELDL